MNKRGRKGEVVYFPDYSPSNPYQALFYSSVSDVYAAHPGSIAAALWRQKQAALDETVIFHLHWEDAIYKHVKGTSADKTSLIETFFDRAQIFKSHGGVFVWTIHNKSPHDTTDTHLHQLVSRRLSVLADGIHLHSTAAAEEVRELFQLDQRRLYIVPHGNYWPVIDKHLSKEDARQQLGIPKNRRIFTLFGRMLAYKGGAALIDAFRSIGEATNSDLWICGKQIDRIKLDGLTAEEIAHIKVRDEFLPQGELNLHLTASDFVVLPYQSSLTSGSIILAFSLGRPVITPYLNAFREITSSRNAIRYDQDSEDGLAEALRFGAQMNADTLKTYEQEAFKTAGQLDWVRIRDQILKMYCHCRSTALIETR